MVLKILGYASLAYVFVLIPLWLFQNRLLYLPSIPGREWALTPSDLGMTYEDLRIKTEDGIRLSAWWVPTGGTERGSVLFLHGNAGNISHRMESIQIFHQLGLSVLIVDYRGYGQSSGTPSEIGTYLDADAAWRHLTKERAYPSDKTVIFGRSLGAAVAARLASTATPAPAALIVESPFTSAPDIAQQAYPFLPTRWLTRFSYETREYVSRIDSPILVIHSAEDEIIPIEHGRRVFSAAPEPKRFLTLKGGHNTGFLESFDVYGPGIDSFLTDMTDLQAAEKR